MEQLQAVQEEGRKESAALEAAEQHFKAVSAGLSTNEDGEEATLAGQMMACKNDMSKADTEAKQVRGEKSRKTSARNLMWVRLKGYSRYSKFTEQSCVQWFKKTLLILFLFFSIQAQMTLKHAQAELKTKQAEVKKMDSGYKKDQDNLQAVRSSREKLEAELAKLNYEGSVSVCAQVKSHAFLPNIV